MSMSVFFALSLLVFDGHVQVASATLMPSDRITVTFRSEPRLEDAVRSICRVAGITCQLDDSIGAEARSRMIGPAPLAFSDALVEDALHFLTSRADLAYSVVDARTVRIHPPAR